MNHVPSKIAFVDYYLINNQTTVWNLKKKYVNSSSVLKEHLITNYLFLKLLKIKFSCYF